MVKITLTKTVSSCAKCNAFLYPNSIVEQQGDKVLCSECSPPAKKKTEEFLKWAQESEEFSFQRNG